MSGPGWTSISEILLTPLAVDVGHPFPFISNLGLSLAVWLYRPGESHPRFVRIGPGGCACRMAGSFPWNRSSPGI